MVAAAHLLEPHPAVSDASFEEIDDLADRIASAAAAQAARECELIEMIGEFDRIGGWRQHGAISCAQWLSWRVGLSPGAARDRVRVARILPLVPLIRERFRAGRISYSKVRALTRVVLPETQEVFLDVADATTAAGLEKICRRHEAAERAAESARYPEAHAARRTLSAVHGDDGWLDVRICLPPDEGARFVAAVDEVTDQLRKDAGEIAGGRGKPPVTPSRVDGLLALVGGEAGGAGSEARVELVLHVEAGELESGGTDDSAEARDGAEHPSSGGAVGRLEGADVPVPIETAKRLTCGDHARRTLTELCSERHSEGGRVLDVGRRTRQISPALNRALRTRDENTCRFPGCHHTRWLHAHHVEHWADGGETRLDNLVLLCSFHHRLVHEGGFTLTMDDDGEVEVANPRGRTLDPFPPLVPDPVRDLLEDRLVENLDVDPYALTPPLYDGRPVPLVEVVDNLLRFSEDARARPPEDRGEERPGDPVLDRSPDAPENPPRWGSPAPQNPPRVEPGARPANLPSRRPANDLEHHDSAEGPPDR